MEGERVFHIYLSGASLPGRLRYAELILFAINKHVPVRVKLHHLVELHRCGYGAFAHIRIVDFVYSDVPYTYIILIIKRYHIGRKVRGSLTYRVRSNATSADSP